MKIKLYPKDLLETTWRKDKTLYADGDAAEPPQCLRCGAPLAAHLMVNALSRYADVQRELYAILEGEPYLMETVFRAPDGGDYWLNFGGGAGFAQNGAGKK